MTEKKNNLVHFGFKFGRNGPHAARTMMFDEILLLFSHLDKNSTQSDYLFEIVENNILNKPSRKSRQLTARHLLDLYSLDNSVPIFRVFRDLWEVDQDARPLLAITIALARDPLLRCSLDFILNKQVGQRVERPELEQLIKHLYPERFSPASIKSFAQNINGSWTSAGYLQGKACKYRKTPTVTPANLTFCLFLAYLEGFSGQRLFHSKWSHLLSLNLDELTNLAMAASNRGQIVFMNAGGVMEVRFNGLLTVVEERLLHE